MRLASIVATAFDCRPATAWVYRLSVVDAAAWPRTFCTLTTSLPPASIHVAALCRSECSVAPAIFVKVANRSNVLVRASGTIGWPVCASQKTNP